MNKKKVYTSIMVVGIASIVMFFAALTSGYIVRRNSEDWIAFDMPKIFWVSTVFVLVSSLTLYLAHKLVKSGKKSSALQLLLLTLGLGIGFIILQFRGFNDMITDGVYFTGQNSSVAGSFMYVIVFSHIVHILVGIFVLLYLLYKTTRTITLERLSNNYYVGGIFWHFLGILWIYLFVFLHFVR